MSLVSIRKQEALNQKRIKELLLVKENKRCFDCSTHSPFFVNITINTFICARCSGLVRELGHRVKSISASIFTDSDLVALEQGGNRMAAKIWLSNYNGDVFEHDNDVKTLIKQKYIECKWLDSVLQQQKTKELVSNNQALGTSFKLAMENISSRKTTCTSEPQFDFIDHLGWNDKVPSDNSGAFQNIISELSGIKLDKVQNVHYTGGILSPTVLSDKKINWQENDRYAALRSIQVPEVNQDEDWQEFCSASSADEHSIDEDHLQAPSLDKSESKVINVFDDLDPLAMFKLY